MYFNICIYIFKYIYIFHIYSNEQNEIFIYTNIFQIFPVFFLDRQGVLLAGKDGSKALPGVWEMAPVNSEGYVRCIELYNLNKIVKDGNTHLNRYHVPTVELTMDISINKFRDGLKNNLVSCFILSQTYLGWWSTMTNIF